MHNDECIMHNVQSMDYETYNYRVIQLEEQHIITM